MDVDPYGPSDNTELLGQLVNDAEDKLNKEHLYRWIGSEDAVLWLTDESGTVIGKVDASELFDDDDGSQLKTTGVSIVGATLLSTNTNTGIPYLFELADKDGNTYYAYCADKNTDIEYEIDYELVNVGDTATITEPVAVYQKLCTWCGYCVSD